MGGSREEETVEFRHITKHFQSIAFVRGSGKYEVQQPSFMLNTAAKSVLGS